MEGRLLPDSGSACGSGGSSGRSGIGSAAASSAAGTGAGSEAAGGSGAGSGCGSGAGSVPGSGVAVGAGADSGAVLTSGLAFCSRMRNQSGGSTICPLFLFPGRISGSAPSGTSGTSFGIGTLSGTAGGVLFDGASNCSGCDRLSEGRPGRS